MKVVFICLVCALTKSGYLLVGVWGADAANVQFPDCRCEDTCNAAGLQGHQHRDVWPLCHL